MKYCLQEGELTCDSEWSDQSMQILVPDRTPIEGSNLVIMRSRLAAGESFESYIAKQRSSILKMKASKILSESSDKIDGREGHFFDLTWVNEGKVLHQTMTALLHDGDRILTFTSTIPGSADEKTKRRILDAVSTFKFAKPADKPAA